MKSFKSIFAVFCILATALSCSQPQQVSNEEGNTVIENIMTRRSIRKFKNIPVSRDTMMIILECGINAPNGQNRQSWEIRVVDEPALMNAMKDVMADSHPDLSSDMVKACFRDAPVMVFIARDKSYDFSAYDCGLLAENMVLSAWSLGVGAICLGSPVRFLTDNESCRQYLERLDFSEGYELSLCVGFGYPDEQPQAKPRDKSKIRFID